MTQIADARNNKAVKKRAARENHGFRFAEITKARPMSSARGGTDGRTYPGRLDFEALKKNTGKKTPRAREKAMASGVVSASPPLRAPDRKHPSPRGHGMQPSNEAGAQY